MRRSKIVKITQHLNVFFILVYGKYFTRLRAEVAYVFEHEQVLSGF